MDKDFPHKRVRLRNGLDIAYVDVANGGVPIVWIHGMGSYRETFHPLLKHPPLEARHLALDLPGFGHSSHLSRRHRLADYAEAVDGFLEALEIPEAVLAGHSFGGMVAGETVDRYPARIRGIILVSSAGWLDPVNALTPTSLVWFNRVGIWVTGMEFFGRRMLRALGVDPATVTTPDRHRLQLGWRKAYEMARMGPFYHSPHFADRVFAAGRPTAVIHGDRDSLFPLVGVTEVIAERSPIWVIEGAGHLPFYSHPETFRAVFVKAYRHVVESPRNAPR